MKLGIISGFGANSFDYVKSLGLEFIESCRNDDNEANAFIANVSSIKENIQRTGITIQSVGRWNSQPNDGAKFNMQQMEIQYALLDAAVEVGSPVFVCGCNYSDKVSLFKNYAFAVEYFGKILDYAKGRIKVAAYNCDWENFIHSPMDWKLVLGELPELGIKFDCSHAINRGEDYLDEICEWGKRIYHFHVKGTANYNGHWVNDPPAGVDRTNWPEVFALLYEHEYNGGLSLEPHSARWASDSDLGKKGLQFSINYIKQFIF